MCKMLLNKELEGIELYFDVRPLQAIIDSLKNAGYRWHNVKKCWYAKQSEKTIEEALKHNNECITAIEEIKTETKNKISLFDRCIFIEGLSENSIKGYKFTGSNYTGLSTKETAVIIRKHLKERFPEVKFSITSDYNSLDIHIKTSPYNNSKLDYDPELSPYQYRDFEKENNKELNAIQEYCNNLLNSYNYDDSDSQSDYFNCHFYKHVSIVGYTQTEQTEEIKADILNFDNRTKQAEQEEEEQKEIDYQEAEKRREEQKESNRVYAIEEARQKEIINNNYNRIDLDESQQYYVINSQFAHLNKNNTLTEYQEECLKGDFYLQTVKIKREIKFNTEEALNYFSNMLLHDFDFISGSGGSYTDDPRIQTMTDYNNLTEEERKTVIFNLEGIAIYYNNELKFVIDSQGYNYSRYVGLAEGTTIQKDNNIIQLINKEEITALKDQANKLIEISNTVITAQNITDIKASWTEYKEAFKEALKVLKVKINKSIIQQLTEEHEQLKVSMYRLLIEVDGIQEQFKNAELQQGQKLTLFYISDFGSIIDRKITFDSFTNESYAQYNNNIKLIFKPDNKKSLYSNNFHSDLLVYDGWQELPKTVLHDIKESNGMICTSTKYLSCDKTQYDEILNYFMTSNIKPIINTYKPIF